MSTSLDEGSPVAARIDGPAELEAGEYHAVFPAAPEAVPAARGYLRAVTRDCCPRVGEMELIASELASCAVHGTPGGVFAMTVRRGPGWLRMEVATIGSGWWPAGEGQDAVAHGYGLAIVAALAGQFGHQGTAGGAAVLWAEVAISGGAQQPASGQVERGAQPVFDTRHRAEGDRAKVSGHFVGIERLDVVANGAAGEHLPAIKLDDRRPRGLG